MRVLQVVAADRWTGAAAVALQLAEALRGAGVDCEFAYRGGDNLEERLHDRPWCHPVLRKERSIADVRGVLGGLSQLLHGCGIVHCHLPHDHLLARLAVRRASVVRSIHHPRHLRGDPFYRWLLRRCHGVACANVELLSSCRRIAALGELPMAVFPVAVEDRFHAVGRERLAGAGDARRVAARNRLGIPVDVVLAGCVGKLDRDRGHDLLLHALAAAPEVWGVLVGAGPWEDHLRRLARRLSVAERTVMAGYVEEGLEDLHAAMDLYVFPAAGSQWSHRANAEAAASGLPVLAADLAGVRDLVSPGTSGDLFPAGDAAALAVLLCSWGGDGERRRQAGERAARQAAGELTAAALAAVAMDLYRLAGVAGGSSGDRVAE